MADMQHSASTTAEAQTEREFTVSIRPHALDFWEYFGTRAQLEAEGVIPSGMEWPATGAKEVGWKEGRLKFGLRRIRPEGLKGPMRL